MRSAVSIFLVSVLICSVSFAHETDQFTVPPGRDFADVGDHISKWMYGVIERGMEKVNDRIRRAVESNAGEKELAELQSQGEIVRAVNSEMPWAMDVIEGLEVWIDRPATKRRYPGKVVGYKEKFTNIYQHVHFPLDPRQFFRLFLGSTMKVYGVYIGTDKIGHFTDMGMNYYREYHRHIDAGKTDAEAWAKVLDYAENDAIFGERGMLGLASAGAYSNADLVANYTGFLFYRNLTEPVMLKGQEHPPMLVRDGPYWRLNDYMTRDSDFFAWFISDHLNEALNPSFFESGMRKPVREAIRERKDRFLPLYRDEFGRQRTREYFDAKVQELSTYWGVNYGHVGTLDDLITVSKACFEGDTTEPPPTPLYVAMHGGPVDAPDQLGRTALHWTARNLDADAVKGLLDKGANPAAADHEGLTPLHLAAANANASAVEALISGGAKTDMKDRFGITPLHGAASNRNGSAVVKRLLAAGADPNFRDDFGYTPLHEAARSGSADSIELLVSKGADVNAKDKYGTTPLHLACRGGHIAAVRTLLKLRADVNAANDAGSRPLHDAAISGDRQVVQALLDAGADRAALNARQQSPQDVARSKDGRDFERIAEILSRAEKQR